MFVPSANLFLIKFSCLTILRSYTHTVDKIVSDGMRRVCASRSKNFIHCYRNAPVTILYVFSRVPVPQVSHLTPLWRSESPVRTLMGTGRLKKAKSASQNESE